MTAVSQMTMKLRPGQRDAAIAAFKARRVLEECAEAVPGFEHGELLMAEDCPDTVCVTAHWADAAAFQAWAAHPVRARQEADLIGFLAEAPVTRVFTQALRRAR